MCTDAQEAGRALKTSRSGMLLDGEAAPSYAALIDDGDRGLKVQRPRLLKYAVQQGEHLGVRVRTAPEQDDAWTVGLVERQEPRVVEIDGDHDPIILPGSFEDFGVAGGRELDLGGVNSVVANGPEVFNRPRGHGHVDEELHPWISSMVSSSARLAAYRRASSMSSASR